MFGATPEEKAYFAPFLALVGLILLGQATAWFFDGRLVSWVLGEPAYWVNPGQALIGGALLLRYRRFYSFGPPRQAWLALGVGVVVLLLWLAPQELFRASPRYAGFNPFFFGPTGPPYWITLFLRFVKLVIVVPFAEEIFWRGFVLRFAIDPNFLRVPFGTFRWNSFLIATVGFTIEHNVPDWPAAALAGALYNLVAYRTRSLSSCVLAHAATNLLLGIYVLRTGQWGFW